MLKKILEEALIEHDFCLISQLENSSYYIHKKGESVRFSVLHQISHIPSPAELNNEITKNAPLDFLKNPAFKKNCDLICILRIKNLSEFKENEESIFSIEEDPYQYKKYVLYYSEIEENIIKDTTYKDIVDIVSNKEHFKAYKLEPLQSSVYSLAAKIFIKLPFLELSHRKEDLVPLKYQAEELVSELELSVLYKKIQKSLHDEQDDDTLIRELINNELENITN